MWADPSVIGRLYLAKGSDGIGQGRLWRGKDQKNVLDVLRVCRLIRGEGDSQRFTTAPRSLSKSLTLRVTMVSPCSIAVAAIKPSTAFADFTDADYAQERPCWRLIPQPLEDARIGAALRELGRNVGVERVAVPSAISGP